MLADAGVSPLRRGSTAVFQLNIGLFCNQACKHCHVESSPRSVHGHLGLGTGDRGLAVPLAAMPACWAVVRLLCTVPRREDGGIGSNQAAVLREWALCALVTGCAGQSWSWSWRPPALCSRRTEAMSREVAQRCVALLAGCPSVTTLDITGGAPEFNPNFRWAGGGLHAGWQWAC